MAAMKNWNRSLAAAALLLGIGTAAYAQGRVGPPPPVTYDNKYELYGGLQYMNFKAGENLPKRMNLGGAEMRLARVASRHERLEGVAVGPLLVEVRSRLATAGGRADLAVPPPPIVTEEGS